MPLISPVGRKSLAVRLLTATLYAILVAGAFSMVYPFLLMVSGSFKTNVDKDDFDILPAFLVDDAVLYRKFLEGKYNNSLGRYNETNRVKAYEFRTIDPPPDAREQIVRDEVETRFDEARRRRMTDAETRRITDETERRFNVERKPGMTDKDQQDLREQISRELVKEIEEEIRKELRQEVLVEFAKGTWDERERKLAAALERRVSDWKEFESQADLPAGSYYLGFTQHAGDRLRLWKHREFRQHLMDLCQGRIEEYNRRFEAPDTSWVAVGSVGERLTERRYQLSGTALEKTFYDFKAAQPTWFRVYTSLDGKYVQGYLEAIHGRDIEKYNQLHDTHWKSYRELVLDRTVPDKEPARREWEQFVREELNLQFIRVRDEARPDFAAFLRGRYADNLRMLNERYGTAFASFDLVTYPDDLMHASTRLVDWSEFIKTVRAEQIVLTGPEVRYRDFLKARYAGDLAALNDAQGTDCASFEHVRMPIREADHADFLANRTAVRREFLTANYKQVADYIFLHGRSLWNTAVYCVLAIVTALTVNPLAAYALSRFKLPSTYKVLLFCMATMAFPAAVTMIPNFLLLKQLGLLNTYAALVLPGMANGFSIFLLKGFFDSLPRELYECAELDGAGEWIMFWQFSMALSKPILAVLALNAFTAAYGNFMFAFILCPDEKMWTLMVFLYQLQNDGHMALTFAALLIAAVPTFVVFVFCQNIIIRGIVVPVEK